MREVYQPLSSQLTYVEILVPAIRESSAVHIPYVCDCRRQYQVVMSEMLNPLYLTFPVLERLPTPRNLRYKKAVNHMYTVLEGADGLCVCVLKRIENTYELQSQSVDTLRMIIYMYTYRICTTYICTIIKRNILGHQINREFK